MRALSLRFGLSGALAGVLAGGVDYALVARRLGPFLPTGPLRLLGFLSGLYGLFGLFAGVGLALVFALFSSSTDLGPLVRGEDRPGPRISAYGLAALASLAGIGVFTRQAVELYLLQFHHRGLIGALSGATVAGLALLGLAFVLLCAPLVSRLIRIGPPLVAKLRAPRVAAPALIVGLYVTVGLTALHLVYLLGRVRMSPAQRALNAAFGAPAFVVLGLTVGYALYRLLARFPFAQKPPTPGAVGGGIVATLVVPILVSIGLTWSTVRQLDLRPFTTAAILLVSLFLIAHVLRAQRLSPLLSLVVLLPLVAVVGLGRIPRVRKAAGLVGLGPHLMSAIQHATDFDRDGYSSLLGGGDCDDLDRRVHPGAFDWPDDGVDQDCNGHAATLSAQANRGYAAVPASVPERPNVLLITVDALRADHVSSYGYDRRTTPRLDELAKEGVRFENAWAHAPSTRYSVPAILIGRYPSTIPVNNDPRVHWPPQVLPENRLISEIMKDQGYRTAATLPYHYFERGWGLDQGFDDYDYHLYTLHTVGGDPSATSGSSSRQLADLDIEWLRAHKDQPFFLWSHFYDTHYRFDRHPDLPETDFGSDELALYDGEIRYADHHIGRIFDTLRELGLWEKTIVIVTADHGDGFGEHGIPVSRRHGYHLYRTETKVPVIVRVPGLAPRVVDTPIGHVDLLPTLLNLLRRPASEEPQLLGDSQLPAMLGDESQKDARAIYQEVWYEGPTSKRAIVTRGAHLIRNLVPEDTTELYDLGKDPGEDHDLSGLGEPLEAQLSTLLAERTDALAIPYDFAQRLKDARSKTPTTPSQPLGDELGDLVRVRGADVENPRPRAGQTAVVTAHLEIRRDIPEGWILFTHVIGPNGRSMNLDHAPLDGLAPLHTIEPGTFVRDPIRIALPVGWPPGATRVEIGLYRKGKRAAAKGAHVTNDAVTIATIEVQP